LWWYAQIHQGQNGVSGHLVLGVAYRYAIKIELKLKQKTQQFGIGNPSQQKQGKGSPNPENKGKRKYGQIQDHQPKLQVKRDTRKMKKDTWKWCNFHKSLWNKTANCCSKKSLVIEVKFSNLDVGSDSESEL
jgi:hypothetical protein